MNDIGDIEARASLAEMDIYNGQPSGSFYGDYHTTQFFEKSLKDVHHLLSIIKKYEEALQDIAFGRIEGGISEMRDRAREVL